MEKNMATAATGYRISSGWQDGTETLYAIITTPGAHASVYDNGSVRIKFPTSGRVLDVTPPAGVKAIPEESVRKAVEALSVEDIVPVVHRPPTFTSTESFFEWLGSIGLEPTSYIGGRA
jgi:hypothetical protein